MLDKVIGIFGAVFVNILFALCGAMFVGLVGEWYALQNEAAYLANSMAKYGGYTTEANAELARFISERGLDRTRLAVQVSAPGGPVPWGTPVRASVTYRFPYRVGRFVSFDVPLVGSARAVSAYVPGTYSVTYTYPAF